MTISDDYFAYYEQYIKEYGGHTCILMQIGSFYEMQAVRNETESIGNLEEVCGVLNILVTKKKQRNRNSRQKQSFVCGIS